MNVKHGEQTGLETLVVPFAVNDVVFDMKISDRRVLANALNTPPEYYNRKVQIHKKLTEICTNVEHVV